MNQANQVPALHQSGSVFTTPLRIVLATTAAMWLGALDAQASGPLVPRGVSEIRFRDIFRAPVGPAGLELSDSLCRADGLAVRLVGYMVQQAHAPTGRFLLTPYPVQMSEHAGDASENLPLATVAVYLDPSQSEWAVPFERGLVAVSGVMAVGRHEGPDGRVCWVRVQLDAGAARGLS